jgi:outer membrane protein OmpA-like peptidoglycan-associated protein
MVRNFKKMKRYSLNSILILALILLGSIAQAQSSKMKAANRFYDNLSFVDAIRLYEDVLKNEKNLAPAIQRDCLKKLAFSYRRMQDTRNAERIYADLIAAYPDIESENYLYYAQALAINGKTRESQRMYSKYGELQSNDLRGQRFTVAYMDIGRFYQDSAQYRVAEVPINSRQADFSPMYYKKGIVFVSARDEGGATKRVFSWNQTPFLDLYFVPDTTQLLDSRNNPAASVGGAFSTKDTPDNTNEKPLTKVEVFSRTLNTKYHEGPMTFFKDESKVIFTRNNYNKGKYQRAKDGTNKLKLYMADLKGDSWSNVRELPFNSNEYSTGHPALSPDNKRLYFVSDMPGGEGGTDVYVVEYLGDNKWSSPVNVGREINTEGNEMFPYLDANGHLYFASDGHEGLGGLDIFYAEMKEGIAYRGVQNLGAPINSEKDDFGLIANTERSSGFFSSNRKKGIFDDNIYAFSKACKQLQVLVYDADTKMPIEAADLRMVVGGENRNLSITRPDGSVSLCLDANLEYEFKASKEGYSMNSLVYSTKTNSSTHQTKLSIYLEKTKNQLLKGVVKSELTQAPMPGVRVILKDDKSQTEQTVVTGADGAYEFEVKPNSQPRLIAQKNEFGTTSTELPTPEKNRSGGKAATTSVIKNDLSLLSKNEVYTLNNIYYDFGQFFIKPDAAQELDRLADIMVKNPNIRIELRSHTDARSSDLFNRRLSESRARAAKDYLISRGIDPARIEARGYGEASPINECVDGVKCTEDEHKQNRRTEFVVLSVQ